MNILQQAHGVSLKFFDVFIFLNFKFKETNRKLTAISYCESSGELSVSMVLAHTFTGMLIIMCLVHMVVEITEKNL